ncbi:DUF2185 domain-containing protein [Rhizobium sp. TH2]|uniref:DUF2185 domain-containing protein n=1 Tax=Rhizobium sp. TH2 TaxID=2775403 RepID=UPI0021571523|nr:DUF2185 domain-containing protein [Rhizobium sp. TH2]UVC08426.1 DUF2185 domain-containing protein [Rhizobium sp. TH2]
MAGKKYKPISEFVELPEWGGGCIATDRITVDGARVGYMYREEPIDELDTGWRFLAGDEDEEYMNDTAKHGVYRVETIFNYDPGILGYLHAPEGKRFELESNGLGFRELDDDK